MNPLNLKSWLQSSCDYLVNSIHLDQTVYITKRKRAFVCLSYWVNVKTLTVHEQFRHFLCFLLVYLWIIFLLTCRLWLPLKRYFRALSDPGVSLFSSFSTQYLLGKKWAPIHSGFASALFTLFSCWGIVSDL